jgi:hypothetical protein
MPGMLKTLKVVVVIRKSEVNPRPNGGLWDRKYTGVGNNMSKMSFIKNRNKVFNALIFQSFHTSSSSCHHGYQLLKIISLIGSGD